MYIVNDIEHLLLLLRILKVNEFLPASALGISRLKAQEYSALTIQKLNPYTQISRENIDDLSLFETWRKGKDQLLSGGDLSTIYVAARKPRLTVLLSPEDHDMPGMCDQCNVSHKQWDEVIAEIADERMVEFYNSLKKAS